MFCTFFFIWQSKQTRQWNIAQRHCFITSVSQLLGREPNVDGETVEWVTECAVNETTTTANVFLCCSDVRLLFWKASEDETSVKYSLKQFSIRWDVMSQAVGQCHYYNVIFVMYDTGSQPHSWRTPNTSDTPGLSLWVSRWPESGVFD